MQSFPIAIPLDAATPQIIRILPPPCNCVALVANHFILFNLIAKRRTVSTSHLSHLYTDTPSKILSINFVHSVFQPRFPYRECQGICQGKHRTGISTHTLHTEGDRRKNGAL